MGSQLSEENSEKARLLFNNLDDGRKGYLVLHDMRKLRGLSKKFEKFSDDDLMSADRDGDRRVSIEDLEYLFIKFRMTSKDLNKMCEEMSKKLGSRRIMIVKARKLLGLLRRKGRVVALAVTAFRTSILPTSAAAYSVFLPQIFLRRLSRTEFRCLNNLPIHSSFFGVTAFVDVSGFTRLTENLAKHGRIGVEMLCAILDRFFTKLVTIVHKYGGDIVKFAGDAMLILWK
eukprot:1329723-Amorphochlora_amoeboformis.AAC.1